MTEVENRKPANINETGAPLRRAQSTHHGSVVLPIDNPRPR
ncbi:hypothetical protein [Paractinoplanes rishiriensis]|nr:hypothetical protein [Actinoplanes rishiriensis]